MTCLQIQNRSLNKMPGERFDLPFLKAGVKFHNLCFKDPDNPESEKPESWVIFEKNILGWQRGNDSLVVINKTRADQTFKNLLTSLKQGKYEDLNSSDILIVEKNGIVTQSIFKGKTAYYFVRSE